MIHKILISNRGEIAVRISKTCRDMGITAVAVYTDVDENSLHVRRADEAVHLGSEAGTYLDSEHIIAAAQRSGADAIHPGYGFLAENSDFARRCAAANLIFIGPSPEAIAIMGSKDKAKQLVAELGLPVIPGDEIADPLPDAWLETAAANGYPILLKAVAGGGGIGMRVVHSADELPEAMAAAQQEAQAAFGNSTLLLEKHLQPVRHVEVQIIADQHGHVVHAFERECSIQRRRQKVVEEAPAPSLSLEMRQKLGETAVTIAKAINYHGVGTIEFLLDEAGSFYFLEMNTRLQVEHGITEAITGLDLVRLQIQIAEGQPLPFRQEELAIQGHALECRLCAEDPAHDFRPVIGTIQAWRPVDAPEIRLDSGVDSGSAVSVYYDPLLAKIIAYAATRPEAIRKMQQALRGLVVHGLITNQPFLQQIMAQPAFLAGQVTTDFIETHLPPEKRAPTLTAEQSQTLAIVGTVWRWRQRPSQLEPPRAEFNRWASETFQIGSEPVTVQYQQADERTLTVQIEDEMLAVVLLGETAVSFDLRIDGWQQRYHLTAEGNRLHVHALSLGNQVIERHTRFQRATQADPGGSYRASMPGRVVRVLVEVGTAVTQGQKLLVMESMKMENSITAAADGIVTHLRVAEGDLVEADTQLIVVEENERI